MQNILYAYFISKASCNAKTLEKSHILHSWNTRQLAVTNKKYTLRLDIKEMST